MRPSAFAQSAAPLALAGLAPARIGPLRAVTRGAEVILVDAIIAAAGQARADLDAAHRGVALGQERLAGRYASLRA